MSLTRTESRPAVPRRPADGPGVVVLRREASDPGPAWDVFQNPVRVLQALSLAEVIPTLREVESAAAQGHHAAGFVCYEAAPAFDAALAAAHSCPLPHAWFGVYDKPPVPWSPEDITGFTKGPLAWQPGMSFEQYARAVVRIKDLIASGDTYQVNYTWRLRAAFNGDPWGLFCALCPPDPRPGMPGCAAFVDLGDHAICSASPELFFHLEGDTITCRPMKGTAPRGRTLAEDKEQAARLGRSAKDRAENVMIVDMIRNDLGRIARAGSVRVSSLFDVEKYDTLFQMTSTVQAATDACLTGIFRALFPCASITGAPKVRTSQIIAELERQPRGIYCGCIGRIGPGRSARFSVAIRTVHIDRRCGAAEYGTGGGVVWDSDPQSEYDECLTKSLVLSADATPFSLLETLRWTPEGGYWLLEHHLRRLRESGLYFDIPVDAQAVTARLQAAAADFARRPMRVRLLVDQRGAVSVETAPLDAEARPEPWRVALARRPVDSADRFLYHKTTRRKVYEAARAERPGCDDVLLWNERGEITETTIANVILQLDGEMVTPPVSCGLLPGTFRADLLERGEARERVITREDLARAEALYLVNSVRGRIPAVLAPPELPRAPGTGSGSGEPQINTDVHG